MKTIAILIFHFHAGYGQSLDVETFENLETCQTVKEILLEDKWLANGFARSFKAQCYEITKPTKGD